MEGIASVIVIIIFVVAVIVELIKEKDKYTKENIKREEEFEKHKEYYERLKKKLEEDELIYGFKENTINYKIGEWEEEVRKDMKPIVSIKDKYKSNKDIKVLVGDYNKSSVSNSVCVLESMGLNVNIAKSGAEVIERIKNNEKYDLIITNNIYDQGNYDGRDVLAELRNIKDFNIPIIVLTVSSGKRNEFVNIFGFDEYMTKLLTQEKVLNTIPNVIKDIEFTKVNKKQ